MEEEGELRGLRERWMHSDLEGWVEEGLVWRNIGGMGGWGIRRARRV